jgi:hypothetical protein
MATGIILNRYLCYKTEAAFLAELKKGYIKSESIVFILETQCIYTHGKYFYCGFNPETQKILAESLSSLESAMKEKDESVSAALSRLESDKIDKSELDTTAIKTEIQQSGARTIEYVTSLTNSALQKIDSALEDADLQGNGRTTSASLSELAKNQSLGFEGLAAAINDLKSQIKILQEQINKL